MLFLFEKTIIQYINFQTQNKLACLSDERQGNDLKSSSSRIGVVVESVASHNSLRCQPKFYTTLSINKYEIVETQKRTAQVAKTPTVITKTLKKQIHTAKAQHTMTKVQHA